MNLRDFSKRGGLWLCAMLALIGYMPAAAAGLPRDPTLLVQGIRQDALRINQRARRFDRLTLNADVRWRDYDRQWIRIEPLVADIGRRLDALSAMRRDLTRPQWKNIQISFLMYGRVQESMRSLRVLLDSPGVTLTNPGFRIASKTLAWQARLLARTL